MLWFPPNLLKAQKSLMEMTPIKKMSAFFCIFFIYSFLTNLYSSSSNDCNGENDDIDNEEEEEEEAMSVTFISHFLPIGLHLSFRMSEPEPAEVPSTPCKHGRPCKNPVIPIPAKFVICIYIEENLPYEIIKCIFILGLLLTVITTVKIRILQLVMTIQGIFINYFQVAIL